MHIVRLEVKGFGKLKDRTVDLVKGINIIYGSNEAGKTTLQWFIRGVFFGLKGAGNPRSGPMQPRKRFLPWGGGPFGGAIIYTLDDGRGFRVERDFEKETVRLLDSHYNDITDLFEKGRDRQPVFAGKHLGLDETALNRTAFIRQTEVRLDEDSTSALAGMLANTGGSGFDEISFNMAEKALADALKNNIGTVRTTTQPLDRLEARLQQLNLLKDKLRQQENLRDVTRKELTAAGDICAGVNAERLYLEQIGELIEIRRLLDNRLKQESGLKEAVRQLKEAGTVSAGMESVRKGPLISENGYLESCQAENPSELSGNLESKRGKQPGKNPRNTSLFPNQFVLLSMMLFFMSMFAYSAVKGFIPALLPITLVSAAGVLVTSITAVIALRNGRLVPQPGENLTDSGAAGGGTSMQGNSSVYKAQELLISICSSASLLCGRQLGTADDISQELQEITVELERLSERLDAGLETAAEAGNAIIGGSVNSGTGIMAGFFRPDTLYTVLVDSDLDNLGNKWKREMDTVNECYLDTALKEKYYEGLLEDSKTDNDELQRVEEETVAVKEKIAYLKHKGDALRLAQEVLSEAALEIRRSVAPELDKRMSSIISSLTSGKYSVLKGDDKLGLNMPVPETGDVRNALLLSGATADQMYLALRLAMTEILTAGGESLPLVMDEVFSQFDDNRTALALKYLQNTYEKGQVLIFTCKRREVELAREICGEGLNLVEL